MPPNPTAVTGVLRQVVHYHLDNRAHDNALFFAERLSAHDPRSSESFHLLALCHLRLGDNRTAYDISKPAGYRGINLGCAWVFAHACLALDRHKDGITALEKARSLWMHRSSLGNHSAGTRSPCPDAGAVLSLLGKLCRGYDDKKRAILCFEEALRLNPFMWDAFTALCDMGVNVRVPNVFKLSDALSSQFLDQNQTALLELQQSAGASDLLLKKPSFRSAADPTIDPFDLRRSPTLNDIPFGGNVFAVDAEVNELISKASVSRVRAVYPFAHNSTYPSEVQDTPMGPSSGPLSTSSDRLAPGPEPPPAPARRTRAAQTIMTATSEAGSLEGPPKMSYRLGSKRTARGHERLPESSLDLTSETPSSASVMLRSNVAPADRKRTVSGHPRPVQIDDPAAGHRRSARLNMFKPSVTKANSGAGTVGATATRELKKARPQISRIIRPGASGSSVGRVVSGNRKPLEENSIDIDHGDGPRITMDPAPAVTQPLSITVAPAANGRGPSVSEVARTEEALRWILDLVKRLGLGYHSLAQFQCGEALQAYGSLPKAHTDTPWVQAQMGRAYYEQAAYADAERFFRRVRVLAPTRVEDMELYSTILWHLKRDTDLSFLSHELIDSSWFSSQAWCAVGNAWSLARDHEQALRCFRRATQLDSKFAYAYTLQGHEHVANEEYEKALTAYRQAITADRRHYNAYYGIGRVQERLGNYEKAYIHFHAASLINPTNAVLICCIGNVLERQKKIAPALQYFTRAVELAPHAAQTRFKRARALLAIGNLEAAQKELIILRDLIPDEARVHFLLGKLYRCMNEKQLAVRHFSNALALDPKAAQQIKEAIESFEDDEFASEYSLEQTLEL